MKAFLKSIAWAAAFLLAYLAFIGSIAWSVSTGNEAVPAILGLIGLWAAATGIIYTRFKRG